MIIAMRWHTAPTSLIRVIALCGFLIPLACAQDIAESTEVEHAMQAAHAHVERLENSVPNFICSEQIRSSLFLDNKLKQETRAQAVLTTTRSVKEGRGLFTETRADMRINGKASKKNRISGPFVWEGGPAYGDLHFLFNSEMGSSCLSHSFLGTVKLDGKDALLIETKLPQATAVSHVCQELRPDISNRIWIEPKTLNVMRIESRNPPVKPAPESDLTLIVDYSPVSFDGAEYWLPSHFISRLDVPYTSRHLQYEAFFADYHKYGAESSFHVEPDH